MLSTRKLKKLFQTYKLELTTGINAYIDYTFDATTADSHENLAWKVNSHFFSLYRDYSN